MVFLSLHFNFVRHIAKYTAVIMKVLIVCATLFLTCHSIQVLLFKKVTVSWDKTITHREVIKFTPETASSLIECCAKCQLAGGFAATWTEDRTCHSVSSDPKGGNLPFDDATLKAGLALYMAHGKSILPNPLTF